MDLTEAEQLQLQDLAEKHPVVKKIIEELESYEEDISKLYMSSLKAAIRDICLHMKNKTLDMDDAFTKAVLKLAESGDKVFNTLQRGQQVIEPPEDESDGRLKKSKAKNIPI